jgi:GNAT superfamily N-acetyltransferase
MAPDGIGNSALAAPTASRCGRTIEVRLPDAAEVRACRMMLPEAFERGITPDLMIAVERDPQRFVGALSYAPVLFEKDIAWQVQLHVVRGYRRRGIGRWLVEALNERGGTLGVKALLGLQSEHAVDGPQFLTAIGFAPAYRSSVYVATRAQCEPVLRPLGERLRASGKVPATARWMTVATTPRESLLAFLNETALRPARVMTTPWEDLLRRPGVREASVVLLDGDTIVGASLLERHGTVSDVHWRVVAPAYRGGWANVILSSAMWDRLTELGITHVKFSTTTETPDTERMVRLYGVEQSHCVVHYHRAVDGGHDRDASATRRGASPA